MSITFPITWRLRECMAKAKIDSALELHRRMKQVVPNRSQLTIESRRPDRPQSTEVVWKPSKMLGH